MLMLLLLLKSIAALLAFHVPVPEVTLAQQMTGEFRYLYDLVACLARRQHLARLDVVKIEGIVNCLAFFIVWVACDPLAAEVAQH